MTPIKVAIVTNYPVDTILSPDQMKLRYRNRISHPVSWVRGLVQALSERSDIDICIFTFSRAVSTVTEGRENDVRFVVIPQYEPSVITPYLMYQPARLQFRHQIKKYSPDIVHGFGTESLYGVVSTEQHLPSVVTIQGIIKKLTNYMYKKNRFLVHLLSWYENLTVNRANYIVASTEFSRKWAQYASPHAIVHEIPNAVNPDFFVSRPRFLENDCLFVGTVTPTKAVDTAIRAIAATSDKSIKLNIVGIPALQGELLALCNDLGVLHRVNFLGHLKTRKEVVMKMQQSKMLLVLSRMDTSPTVVTEAHAAGLPVIGTRAGGIPDMIADGKDGFLIDIDDYLSAAQKIDLLSSDAELCRRLGQSGRKKVALLNNARFVAEQHVQLYKNILDIPLTDPRK